MTPCWALLVTKALRERMVGLIILLWSALGLRLSYHKGARGQFVVWIGDSLEILAGAVRVGIKESILQDLRGLVAELDGMHVLPLKKVRRVDGIACHAASAIFMLRPFLQQFWAALPAERGHAPPKHTVWHSQVVQALL